MTALSRQKKETVPFGPTLVVGYDPASRTKAFVYVKEQREKGINTELDCMNLKPGELLDYANEKGIGHAVFIGANGTTLELD